MDRPARIVTGKRGDEATTPTSVGLTVDEKTALDTLATKTKRSRSALMRLGIQKILAEHQDVVPPSIGIVDGIYPASIHDDVASLSNAVVALGYVVQTLEKHVSRARRLEARAQLADVVDQLLKIAGRTK